MKIEFAVPFRRAPTPRTHVVESVREPQGLPPRIARLLALAHKLDAMVRSGEIRDYAQLARLGHISPARLTQIMVLLHLAPAIQESILFFSAADARFVMELGLRKIAREPRWDRQQELFERLLPNGLAYVRRRSDECHDAATAAKGKTENMTTSKQKIKNATAVPATKARVAKPTTKVAARKAKPAAKLAGAATAARGGSKTAKILDLLQQPGGVTLKDLAKATGWQPNSVRGFLSGTDHATFYTPLLRT